MRTQIVLYVFCDGIVRMPESHAKTFRNFSSDENSHHCLVEIIFQISCELLCIFTWDYSCQRSTANGKHNNFETKKKTLLKMLKKFYNHCSARILKIFIPLESNYIENQMQCLQQNACICKRFPTRFKKIPNFTKITSAIIFRKRNVCNND